MARKPEFQFTTDPLYLWREYVRWLMTGDDPENRFCLPRGMFDNEYYRGIIFALSDAKYDPIMPRDIEWIQWDENPILSVPDFRRHFVRWGLQHENSLTKDKAFDTLMSYRPGCTMLEFLWQKAVSLDWDKMVYWDRYDNPKHPQTIFLAFLQSFGFFPEDDNQLFSDLDYIMVQDVCVNFNLRKFSKYGIGSPCRITRDLLKKFAPHLLEDDFDMKKINFVSMFNAFSMVYSEIYSEKKEGFPNFLKKLW